MTPSDVFSSLRFWSKPPPPPASIMENMSMFFQSLVQWVSSQAPVMTPDLRGDKMPLMSSAAYPVGMIMSYALICLYIGPKLTKLINISGIPELKSTITPFLEVFNFVRVLMNGILGGLLAYFAYYKLNYSLLCQPMEPNVAIQPTESQYAYDRIFHYMWSFHIFKIIEVLDIIFLFELKKNLSAFQLYHHTSTLAFSWLAVKYLPGGSSVFPVICNCFTGVIVYSFHLMKKNFRQDLLKWNVNNVFTGTLLFTQFATIFGHSCITFWWDCGYPRWASGALMIYMMTFLGGLLPILNTKAQTQPQLPPVRTDNFRTLASHHKSKIK